MPSSSSSSIPFHSSEVREALEEIISNHEEHDANDLAASASAAATFRTNKAGTSSRSGTSTTTAIRGKWSGGYASSSSDEDDGANNDNNEGAGSDDEESVSSEFSHSLDAVEEDNEDPTESGQGSSIDADESAAPAASKNHKGKGKGSTGKRTKNKKSKGDILRRMGKAPSILLPLDVAKKSNDNIASTSARKTNKSPTKALEVPNVLLPINYIRDNPNWKVSHVATSLLSTWDQLNDDSDNNASYPTTIVILLQSGRFAAAVFSLQSTKHSKNPTMKMLAHKTSTKYTVRKGQGGSQSSHDQSKNKAKSMGAQLRRDGEKQLREDVHKTWKEWKRLGYVQHAVYAYVSCPKGMKRDYLYKGGDNDTGLMEKGDRRWRNVPLDVGRPTMEATSAVLDCILSCSMRDMTEHEVQRMTADLTADESDGKQDAAETVNGEKEAENEDVSEEPAKADAPPLTPLHEAVLEGDLSQLMELLKLLDESEENNINTVEHSISYDVNTCGGPDHQTPLHLASSSTHSEATSILNALLIQGHANPCAVDARGRPPYFIASNDKQRETFRLARGKLGEGYCEWDDGAKVGPAMSDADVQAKKAKALEKKRRQRARQKEKKANEKAAAEQVAAKEKEEAQKKKEEEDAKRTRDGLKPKTSKATNVCDFCQKMVKGKRRSQMFQRLEYAYCTTECVRRHQRELMAAAATARMG